MNYPKRIPVTCYCPIGPWNVRSTPNATLCTRCQKWQEYFWRKYDEAVDNLSDFQKALL